MRKRYKYHVSYEGDKGLTGNVYYTDPLMTRGQIEKAEKELSDLKKVKCVIKNFSRIL